MAVIVWSMAVSLNDLAIALVDETASKMQLMLIIGGVKVVKHTKIPKPPTTDLIKLRPLTIEPNASPSALPIIGMKLPETNFAVFIAMPSEFTVIEV